MLLTVLLFLILGCNVILVTSDCPKSQTWRDMKMSPDGPLVCARLYGDSKCTGLSLPFGINSSSPDLGTDSSAAINFESNNVTALVRPGCTMYLWEDANFLGKREKSTNYIWNISRRHYRSALCKCSVDDLELLQCDLYEKWEVANLCDFQKSDIGGLCAVTLKRSYVGNENDVKNITVTESLTHLFADKIVESFGEERMSSFLDVNSSDKLAHSVLVGARSAVKIKQRSYVCGQYHVFTPEVVKHYGSSCEEYSGLCLNGASCINKMGTYKCLCVGGFEGDHCEINIDNCKDNLCHSGSSCVDGIARYECLCAPDRIGELCEHSNPCYGENNKCKHGSCSSDPEHGTYTCKCDSGYNGTNCDQDINECEYNACFDGKCINIEGSFICECEPGYTDPLCMTRINYCHGNPCLNGGTCLNDLGRYDCMCLPGYSGVNCETHSYQDLYNCKLPCQNGGICRSSTANKCECPPAYEGIVCEFEKILQMKNKKWFK